jgi:hypothetical protein
VITFVTAFVIPLVTAFIAAVVAAIAFLQWKTAREKVLLDLFAKRFAVYDELCSVVGRHICCGIDQTPLFEFKRAASRAKFLFGSEVETFLEERWEDLSRETTQRNLQPRPVPADRREAVKAEHLARSKDFDELVASRTSTSWSRPT